MTKREAIRRLEILALQNGYKRNHYVKRALVEFLEKREEFLVRPHSPRASVFRLPYADIAERLSKYPN
jgi:hypothetical protein